jgi:hypothetical protein
MTHQGNFIPPQINEKSIIRRMSLGYVIGLVIISFFVFSVDHPHPDWGKFWQVKPLIITPLAAAFGMLVFYLKDFIPAVSDWKKTVVIIFSAIVYIIALWMGIVLGLNGTLWN